MATNTRSTPVLGELSNDVIRDLRKELIGVPMSNHLHPSIQLSAPPLEVEVGEVLVASPGAPEKRRLPRPRCRRL